MKRHLTANLWLLGLTLLICSVLYPLLLLAIGQTILRSKANGSIVTNAQGVEIGSRLVAQPFTADQYFHPRPSAVSYNASATGGSNWGAASPKLRERVLAMLGPVLKFKDGRPVGPEIAQWVRKSLDDDRGVLSKWSADDSNLATRWSAGAADFLATWAKDHAEDVAGWQRDNPNAEEATPADLASLFFTSYASGKTEKWPETDGQNLQAAFFGVWWSPPRSRGRGGARARRHGHGVRLRPRPPHHSG